MDLENGLELLEQHFGQQYSPGEIMAIRREVSTYDRDFWYSLVKTLLTGKELPLPAAFSMAAQRVRDGQITANEKALREARKAQVAARVTNPYPRFDEDHADVLDFFITLSPVWSRLSLQQCDVVLAWARYNVITPGHVVWARQLRHYPPVRAGWPMFAPDEAPETPGLVEIFRTELVHTPQIAAFLE